MRIYLFKKPNIIVHGHPQAHLHLCGKEYGINEKIDLGSSPQIHKTLRRTIDGA